jgi:hypothetical protein
MNGATGNGYNCRIYHNRDGSMRGCVTVVRWVAMQLRGESTIISKEKRGKVSEHCANTAATKMH